MPTPSKFTAAVRSICLDVYREGGSRRMAAARAGITHPTLQRWLEKGETAPQGSAYRKFYDDVQAAIEEADARPLRIVREAMIDKPELAWKWLERRVEGFAPPQTHGTAVKQQPMVVNLTFHDGDPVPEFGHGTVVEIGEVEKDDRALPAP